MNLVEVIFAVNVVCVFPHVKCHDYGEVGKKVDVVLTALADDAFFDLLAWKAVKVNKQGTLAVI